jgi:two-component system chemotaxis sensor kinase CheA
VREPDPALVELRAVFRGELEDHVVSLERQLRALTQVEPVDERGLRAAIAEVYRAVHSVKGAARAVDFPSIERFCHALETRLAPLRGAESHEVPQIVAYAELAIGALRASLQSLHRGSGPNEPALEAALARMAAGTRSERDNEETEPTPPNEQPPLGLGHERAHAGQTVRVSVARLNQLLLAAEDCMTLTGRHAYDTRRIAALESAIAPLMDELRAAREALRAGRVDALTLLDRPLVTLQAFLAWKEESIRREQSAWLTASTMAADLVARSRALRLITFGSLIPTLERAALEAARALGREVALQVEGADLELDRHALEGLREPLLHVIRNAVDHGIEPPEERRASYKPSKGTLRLTATLAGPEAVITVHDDGRGIDPAAVRIAADAQGLDTRALVDDSTVFTLLFEPGFSLRHDVTELSGRGVGLDIVRERMAELHGRIEVESAPGRGTSFALTVPIDLSVVRGLVARVGDVHVVLISTSIVRLVRVAPSELVAIEGRLHLPDSPGPIPLADLDEMLGYPRRSDPMAAHEDAPRPCVVVAVGDRRAALRVDALIDEREVVLKPAGARLRRAAFVAGAIILSNGEVALVLSVADLIDALRPARPRATGRPPERRQRLLVVDDSITTRQLERTILESAGYEVALAVDGQDAWEQLSSGEGFDLVVSDLEMPKLDGFQLVARIRSSRKLAKLPIILVTALASDDDRQRALRLGANAYLTKMAFDQQNLLESIEQLTLAGSESP